MKNETFYRCKCGNEWTTQKSKTLPHLSRDYIDNSTKEKPFIKKCRKCFLERSLRRFRK